MRLRIHSFIIMLSLMFIFVVTAAYSAETRGLRVMAKETSSGQPKEVKIYNNSYAVIIGIDQYENLAFDQQLAYPVRDAKGVAQALINNFIFDRVITLYNNEATKNNIMKVLLGVLSRETTKEDAVLIFWAGHGYTEKTAFGDLGYLIPYDGTFNTVELYKNISMTTLRDDISKKIPAKHVFFVIDACYGGLLASTRGTIRQSFRDYNYLKEITKESVRQVLTAGNKDQEVLDDGPRGHSVFAGRFIELLENSRDFITATEISTLLKEKVFSDAKARNHIQTPQYGELFGLGDFVFIPLSTQQRYKGDMPDESMKNDTSIRPNAIQTKLSAKDYYMKAIKAGTYYDKIQSLQKAISLEPDYFDAYVLLGRTFLKLSKYQKAVEAFEKALTLKDSLEIHYELGRTYRVLGDNQNATEHLTLASKSKNYIGQQALKLLDLMK